MAKVEVVDYKDLSVKAKDIRKHAEDLNKTFGQIYFNITLLHDSWYGVRYNELASDFNKLIPSVNEMLKITVRDIPFALELVANNFSQADTGANVTSAQETEETKMPEVPTPNDIGMRFMEFEVKTTQTKVSQGFKTAVEKMNTIESIYNKIVWRSESAEAFRSKFVRIKNQIITEIDELNMQFDKLMNQAISDLQSTENKNTVS